MSEEQVNQNIEEADDFTIPGGDGDSGDGAWLTSYADLMTLIACFFILMMAFATFDPVVFRIKSEQISKSFTGRVNNLVKEETQTPPKIQKISDVEEPKELAEINVKKKRAEEDDMEQLAEELKGLAEFKEISKVKKVDNGLEVVIKVKAFFKLGSAELDKRSKVMFKDVIAKIAESSAKSKRGGHTVIVEGHTDNIPVIDTSVYPSNWELSTARASAVVREFEGNGFDRNYLAAIGYADTKPESPNLDEDGRPIPKNQAANRRIVLKVLHSAIKRVPFGLDVLDVREQELEKDAVNKAKKAEKEHAKLDTTSSKAIDALPDDDLDKLLEDMPVEETQNTAN